MCPSTPDISFRTCAPLSCPWWEERGCHSAFMQLLGQEGIIEARISEIPPGQSLPPFKLAVDEVVYVLQGRGLTNVWGPNETGRKTVEWQEHALFLLPRNRYHQFQQYPRAATGPVAPLQLSAPGYDHHPGPGVFSSTIPTMQQTSRPASPGPAGRTSTRKLNRCLVWGATETGGFYGRGISSRTCEVGTSWTPTRPGGAGGAPPCSSNSPGPRCPATCRYSTPTSTKKAHRHGPGRVIVIPGGDGYSMLWEEGKEKDSRAVAGGQRLRAAQPVVPPTLQRR